MSFSSASVRRANSHRPMCWPMKLGTTYRRYWALRQKVPPAAEARPDQAKALSVRMELQADCLAGVWGHSTAQRNILENGTWNQVWERRQPSATIAFSACPPVESALNLSLTGVRLNGWNGSDEV